MADGVGGWRVYGLDPGSFSRTLMRNCAQLVRQGAFKPNEPKALLQRAYDMIKEEDKYMGSRLRCVSLPFRIPHRLFQSTANETESAPRANTIAGGLVNGVYSYSRQKHF